MRNRKFTLMKSGENAGKRFNGMFAAAVWDGRVKNLWLGDQFGQKLIYYTIRNGQMLFASEMKALQVHPDCPSELDQSALSLYLQLICAFAYHLASRCKATTRWCRLTGRKMTCIWCIGRQRFRGVRGRYSNFEKTGARAGNPCQKADA